MDAAVDVTGGRVLAGSAFIDADKVGKRESTTEPTRKAARHLCVARVGRDDDRVARAGTPDRLHEDRHRVEIVHGDAEEALDLRRV